MGGDSGFERLEVGNERFPRLSSGSAGLMGGDSGLLIRVS